VPVVAFDRLECLYEKGVDALVLAARIALKHIRQALAKAGARALSTWKAPRY